jgi:hypothetical protein
MVLPHEKVSISAKFKKIKSAISTIWSFGHGGSGKEDSSEQGALTERRKSYNDGHSQWSSQHVSRESLQTAMIESPAHRSKPRKESGETTQKDYKDANWHGQSGSIPSRTSELSVGNVDMLTTAQKVSARCKFEQESGQTSESVRRSKAGNCREAKQVFTDES